MTNIKDFEAFFLTGDTVKYHILRRREVLLSLPASQEGASHAFRLYRPQREMARLMIWGLGLLVDRGMHRRVLKRGKSENHQSAPSWDFKYSPETVGILLGSSEHLVSRAIASYLGADGWEVAKLGIGQAARAMLRQEVEMLRNLAAQELSSSRCLGLHELGEMTVLRMPYLEGTPVNLEETDNTLDLLTQWIEPFPCKSITEFPEWKFIGDVLKSSQGGREALEALAEFSLRPVISHGDFARWNLLKNPEGTLVALDWEWGIMGGMPGLDLVHYFSQDSRLVRRLNSKEVIRDVETALAKPKAREYLEKVGWADSLLEPILAYAAYKQGVRHQKNPELLAACLRTFLKRRKQSHDTAIATDLAGPSVRFSIVTASYKQVSFLKCAAASVQDQHGDFTVEHLIHDGGSGDEFDEWARSQIGADCVSEPDDGMYDAINRGFRKAKGDIIAWLNCDEQYLPGVLEKVSRFFRENPGVDILFGDVILVDEQMTPLACRRAVMPSLGHIRYSHLSTFSAATFVRRKVLQEGHYLETRWKTIADAVWIEELLAAGYQAATLHEPLAIFCMLGSNLGQSPLLFQERYEWELELGTTNLWKKRWYILQYRLERLRVGAYWIRRTKIAAYLPGGGQRVDQVRWISGQWAAARNQAENLRSERDGSLGSLAMQTRRTRWAIVHAMVAAVLAIYIDNLIGGDAVKGPSILLLSLLYLSFRSKLRDLIPIAVLYFLVALNALSKQPTDIFIVRLVTFSLGAILAVFWSTTLKSLEEWVRSTVALIRKIPVPMVLTDQRGKILLANNAACTSLKGIEENFLSRNLYPLTLGNDGNTSQSVSIEEWAERPPDGALGVSFEKNSPVPLAEARVFVVGKGKYRFYAFMLKE